MLNGSGIDSRICARSGRIRALYSLDAACEPIYAIDHCVNSLALSFARWDDLGIFQTEPPSTA